MMEFGLILMKPILQLQACKSLQHLFVSTELHQNAKIQMSMHETYDVHESQQKMFLVLSLWVAASGVHSAAGAPYWVCHFGGPRHTRSYTASGIELATTGVKLSTMDRNIHEYWEPKAEAFGRGHL